MAVVNQPRKAPDIRPAEPSARRSTSTSGRNRPQLRLVPLVQSGKSLLGRQPGNRPGHESAGRILAIIGVALALAALINADAMVERAERKPFGPGRDRSLAIWHPVQDASHILQIHRLRQLGDALVGDDDGSRDGPALVASPRTEGPASGAASRAVRPELRVPTADAPLRIWVGGDSMVRDLSESVQRLAAPNPLLETTVHYEISSGLTRPDFFDWPAALATDMASTDAEVVIIMFGANDGQGLITADGTVHQQLSDPGWQQEYAVRVASVMEQLRADGRLVFWIAQPPMRDGEFDARMDIVNEIYRGAARGRPWIEMVETEQFFGDVNGQFVDQLPSSGGGLEDLRQDDGIHFARDGADNLAGVILSLVNDEIAQSAAGTAATGSAAFDPG
jgi:hypothetical protein